MKTPVYVIHGLGGIFPFISRGTREIDNLIDAMAETPEIKELSKDYLQTQYSDIIYDIKKHLEHGKISIITIGHSKGVETATRVHEWCARNGVKVAYFAAIDPTAGYTMPVFPNMERVDEFWASSGFPSMARRWWFLSGGKLTVPDNFAGEYKRFEVDCGHIESAEHPTVVNRIIRKVGRLVI